MAAVEAFWLNNWDTQTPPNQIFASRAIPWGEWKRLRKRREDDEKLLLLLLDEV